MRIYDIFKENMIDLAPSFSDKTNIIIQDLCNLCDEFYKDVEAADVDLEFDDENLVFTIALSFDEDQITIKHDSIFWEILDFVDGFGVEKYDVDGHFTDIIFNIVCEMRN